MKMLKQALLISITCKNYPSFIINFIYHALHYLTKLCHLNVSHRILFQLSFILVYGIFAVGKSLLVPWLLVHALLILSLVIAFIIVIILVQPIEHRWFALMPLLFGLYLVVAWIKVRLFF